MTTPQFELEVQGRLPPGWSCHISKSTGKNYYFNNQTGASVWDIKELPPTVAPQITQADCPDPEDFSIEEEQVQLRREQTQKLQQPTPKEEKKKEKKSSTIFSKYFPK